MQEDPQEFVRVLAALAGLTLAPERTAAIAAVLPFLHAGNEDLSAIDYGDIEPAPAFRIPPEAP